MLALASGTGAATRAEGDITVGPKALYTVSEDGSMVEVSYNVDVEGADGEVAESIRANLIISPGFVFPVGEGWLWLANCCYDVKGGWSNNPTDGHFAQPCCRRWGNCSIRPLHHNGSLPAIAIRLQPGTQSPEK